MMGYTLLVFAFIALSINLSLAQNFEQRPSTYSRVVNIRTDTRDRANRDRRPASFEIDGKEYNIDFVQADYNVYSRDIPVWLVKSKPGHSPNYTYERVPNSENLLNDGFIYVDNEKKAVAYVHYDRERQEIRYDGVFGENKNLHVIKSLTGRRFRSFVENGNHIVYKPRFNDLSDSLIQKRRFRSLDDDILDKPLETMHAKILVVIDNHVFRKLGSDIKKTLRYVVTFWNHVDQKYLEIESPKLKILVTGVIIANDETALNYVHQSKLNLRDDDGNERANADLMYLKTRMYFHHNFSKDVDFQNYDAAFVLTGLNTFPIGGVTMNGHICDNWYNDAIVKDDGSYSGVDTAVHELGHLLNIKHDNYNYDGNCPALGKDGSVTVMSPYHRETDNWSWSECSKNYLREFAKTKKAECLATRSRTRNYPKDPMYDY